MTRKTIPVTARRARIGLPPTFPGPYLWHPPCFIAPEDIGEMATIIDPDNVNQKSRALEAVGKPEAVGEPPVSAPVPSKTTPDAEDGPLCRLSARVLDRAASPRPQR